MGAVPEPPLILRGLHSLLGEAGRSMHAGRWKAAQNSLLKIMDAGESLKLCQDQQRRHDNYSTKKAIKGGKASKTEAVSSDVCCVKLLLECGRLWNTLLCMDRAVECFKLAESFGSIPHRDCCHLDEGKSRPSRKDLGPSILNTLIKKVCGPGDPGRLHRDMQMDVLQAWVQTHLYLFQTNRANELFAKLEGGSFSSPSFRSSARVQLLARGLLLDVAQALINEAKGSEAVKRLMSPTWITWSTGRGALDSFTDRCLEAERYSLLAYARYLKPAEAEDDPSNRTAGEIFSDVYRLWERLHWPLDHAEIIINTLSRYAIERIEKGHYGAENPVVNSFLELDSKVWTHSGEMSFSVGRNMYDVSQAAEKIEKHKKSALYGEKTVAVFRSCPRHLPERDMFIGATLYLVGLNYFKENKLDLAIENIEQCIPLLEQSEPRENSPHYLFAMKTLAQAYGDLAHALKIQCGAVEKSLLYSEKALQHKQFLTHSATKTAQAIRADSLHCKGALIEHQGDSSEAEKVYVQADEMFVETVSECSNSFEFVAYGYFLYRRNDFRQAARMLQKGYQFASTGFPSLMFTHDEWHTLTEELKFEVQNSQKKSFDVPNRVVALYFHIMVLVRTGLSSEDVMEFVRELAELVESYDYISCGNKGKIPASKYRCSSLSLLGYAYRKLGKHAEAARAFRKAYRCYPSKAANLNMTIDLQRAKELYVNDYSDSDSDCVDDIDL